ncbi:hypothetical protein FB567DRAFT_321524 [Paraphoma chrysanthemicola]|uniref:FAD/NAD(P)-binding domain-containing protein n=1 Tax=Paraphoma chrysanthemicola TaxID=798071 RepID=A0A8K0W0Q2_9PLEO|nr:hypothetical protein FB567DRAFT_321524 [Paraphoma chrysanthemicola]
MPAQQNSHALTADILIIGGGFGGCYALHKFRSQGYTVKLLEAGSDFGGVWHFNSYPGARVDSEVPLYQLSLPEAWRGFNFSERYPGHEELKRYFVHMVEALDLRRDAVFNARVNGAKWDSGREIWTVKTEGGLVAEGKYVVFATGTTIKAYIPDWAGLRDFKGPVIHPARWPEGLDLKGKRVGLIGQGASGLQILQEIAKEDCQVTVFVRTPSTAIPMGQRQVSPAEAEETKNCYDALFEYAKERSTSGYQWNTCKKSFHNTPPDERQRLYEDLWARGGYAFLTSNFPELHFDKTANAEVYAFWQKRAAARIRDPEKREILAPQKQSHWIGGRRPNLETRYFETMDQDNVELVSLKTRSIARFTNKAIISDGPGGEKTHEVDVVIVATGYDNVTGSLFDINIQDKHGVPLQEKWKDGISTWLGMLIPDTPNALLIYGPQAPSGLANAPPFLEVQVDWLAELLEKNKERGVPIEVKSDKAKEYREMNLGIYKHLLFSETAGWWNGANIPGKTNEPLFWVGGLQAWKQQCEAGLTDLSQYLVSS